MKKIAVIDYTSHRGGLRRNRRVRPRALAFTSDEWHTTPCWMLLATDLDNGEERTFAFANIHRWVDIDDDEENNATQPDHSAPRQPA